jgi:hypothetical protein
MWRLLLLCVLLLTGCGVRVEIAQPAAPTPTARPWWRLYYNGGGVERPLAQPVLAFGESEQPRAELFMRDLPEKTFVLTERQLWLPIYYRATWFAAPQSYAVARLNVYRQWEDDGEWELYDRVEERISAAEAPAQAENTFGIAMYLESPEAFRVRAEVSLLAYLSNGETVTVIDTREFDVDVLANPGDPEQNIDALWPSVEDPDDTQLLLDWRAWRGGPCALAFRAQDSAARAPLDAACAAFEAGDYSAFFAALDGIEFADSGLAADVYAVAGLLLMTFGQPDSAAEAFAAAESFAIPAGDVYGLAAHLHNLGVAQAALGDFDSAYANFECTREMLAQYWDEAGDALLRANLAYLNRDGNTLDSTAWYFRDNGLPQAERLETWLFRIANGIET